MCIFQMERRVKSTIHNLTEQNSVKERKIQRELCSNFRNELENSSKMNIKCMLESQIERTGIKSTCGSIFHQMTTERLFGRPQQAKSTVGVDLVVESSE